MGRKAGEKFKLSLAFIQPEFPNRKTKAQHLWVKFPHDRVRFVFQRGAQAGTVRPFGIRLYKVQLEAGIGNRAFETPLLPSKSPANPRCCKERRVSICKIFLARVQVSL